MTLLLYVLLTGTFQWHSAGGQSRLEDPRRLRSCLVPWQDSWKPGLSWTPLPFYTVSPSRRLDLLQWLRALKDQNGNSRRLAL